MARNTDRQFQNKLLSYIKNRCVAERGPVSMSLPEIALALGESKSQAEKVMRYVEILQRGGHIAVDKGTGASSNTYTFINDDLMEQVQDLHKYTMSNLQALVDKVNQTTTDIVEFCAGLNERYLAAETKRQHLVQILSNLELHSIQATSGKPIYIYKNTTGDLDALLLEIERMGTEEAIAATEEVQ